MTAAWINRALTDEARRCALYNGRLSSSTIGSGRSSGSCRLLEARSSRRLRRTIRRGFTRSSIPLSSPPHLGKLTPAFTHHPESWRPMTEIHGEPGCDVDDIHCDVPKLSTAYPVGYLV